LTKSFPLAALVVVFLLSGCESPPPQLTPTSTQDSAGIEIVESTTPAWEPEDAWRLGDSPEADIGIQEGDRAYELHWPYFAIRLTSGDYVVGNTGSLQVRYYDSHGSHKIDAGGRGGGPGEFQRISWMGVFHDSVIVFDQTQRRLTVFGPYGTFVRSVRLEPGSEETYAAMETRAFYPSVTGILYDGSLLASLRDRARGPDLPGGIIRDSVRLLQFSTDGSLVGTYGTFPDVVRDVQTRSIGERSIRGPADVAFSPRMVWATGSDVTYVATTDSYEVLAYDSEGDLFRIIRKHQVPGRITEEHRDQLVARWREIHAGRLDNPEIKYFIQTLEESPLPAVFPAFDPEDRDERGWRVGTPMIVDAEGNLWVLEYRPPGDHVPVWSVFDEGGRLLGEVIVPTQFRITEIGKDYVLGWWSDESDVPHVMSYPLIKP